EHQAGEGGLVGQFGQEDQAEDGAEDGEVHGGFWDPCTGAGRRPTGRLRRGSGHAAAEGLAQRLNQAPWVPGPPQTELASMSTSQLRGYSPSLEESISAQITGGPAGA